MKKKIVALWLALVLLLSLLAACTNSPAPTQPAGSSSENSSATESSGTASAEPDQTEKLEPVTLHAYFVGEKPTDFDMVMDIVNAKLQETIQATIDFSMLSWSDYQTQYSLVLAAGDNLDMIYTANWCYFDQEARKGAFTEITDELLDKYMPLTKASQHPEAWKQATIDGKIYCVPSNVTDADGKILAYRDDLRQKYNLPEIKDINTLEQYYFTLAEKEPGIFGYDASAPQVSELRDLLYDSENTVMDLGIDSDQIIFWEPGKEVSVDDVAWYWDNPRFIEYCKRIKTWADKGVWSKNAMSKTTHVSDSFENGTSATVAWNKSVFQYGEAAMKKNPDWNIIYVDLSPDKAKFGMPFTTNAIAIAAASKNVERSAMAIDLMKNDDYINQLIYMGIEGRHWVAVDEAKKLYEPGPNQEDYGINSFGWCFTRDLGWTDVNMNPQRKVIEDNMKKNYQPNPLDGFNFNPGAAGVEAELAAYLALRQEYNLRLDMGFVDDVEATIAEFKQKADDLGYNKVVEAMKVQLQTFLDSK